MKIESDKITSIPFQKNTEINTKELEKNWY
jgi:hypothetical protein